MKEDLDRQVNEVLHLADECVAHEKDSNTRDVPWRADGKHTQKDLDWINPAHLRIQNKKCKN
jgi:hypothetical protein